MTDAKAGRTSSARRATAKKPDDILDNPNLVLVRDDLRDLTAGQIEEVEDLIDDTINVFFDRTYRQGKIRRALAYVVRKAEDPSLTYEQSADLVLGTLAAAPVPPTSESA